jgi:hypothetical protein
MSPIFLQLSQQPLRRIQLKRYTYLGTILNEKYLGIDTKIKMKSLIEKMIK